MSESGRLHRCTVCGGVAPWSARWQWFGSHADLEERRPVVKTCSDTCRAGLSATALMKLLHQVRADPGFAMLEAAET